MILFARAELPKKVISVINSKQTVEHTTMTWSINAYQPATEFRQTATDLY